MTEAEWINWMEDEREAAAEQGLDPSLGITVFVERTGFIKRKASGVPNWYEFRSET